MCVFVDGFCGMLVFGYWSWTICKNIWVTNFHAFYIIYFLLCMQDIYILYILMKYIHWNIPQTRICGHHIIRGDNIGWSIYSTILYSLFMPIFPMWFPSPTPPDLTCPPNYRCFFSPRALTFPSLHHATLHNPRENCHYTPGLWNGPYLASPITFPSPWPYLTFSVPQTSIYSFLLYCTFPSFPLPSNQLPSSCLFFHLPFTYLPIPPFLPSTSVPLSLHIYLTTISSSSNLAHVFFISLLLYLHSIYLLFHLPPLPPSI